MRELGALAKVHRLVTDGNALTALPRVRMPRNLGFEED